MNKILLRLGVMLLIPCLIADPRLSYGINLAIVSPGTNPSFTQQAITPFSYWVGLTNLYRKMTGKTRHSILGRPQSYYPGSAEDWIDVLAARLMERLHAEEMDSQLIYYAEEEAVPALLRWADGRPETFQSILEEFYALLVAFKERPPHIGMPVAGHGVARVAGAKPRDVEEFALVMKAATRLVSSGISPDYFLSFVVPGLIERANAQKYTLINRRRVLAECVASLEAVMVATKYDVEWFNDIVFHDNILSQSLNNGRLGIVSEFLDHFVLPLATNQRSLHQILRFSHLGDLISYLAQDYGNFAVALDELSSRLLKQHDDRTAYRVLSQLSSLVKKLRKRRDLWVTLILPVFDTNPNDLVKTHEVLTNIFMGYQTAAENWSKADIDALVHFSAKGLPVLNGLIRRGYDEREFASLAAERPLLDDYLERFSPAVPLLEVYESYRQIRRRHSSPDVQVRELNELSHALRQFSTGQRLGIRDQFWIDPILKNAEERFHHTFIGEDLSPADTFELAMIHDVIRHHPNPDIQSQAVQALASDLKIPFVLPLLMAILHDPDFSPICRATAARALGQAVSYPEVMKSLIHVFEDGEPELHVRIMALKSLLQSPELRHAVEMRRNVLGDRVPDIFPAIKQLSSWVSAKVAIDISRSPGQFEGQMLDSAMSYMQEKTAELCRIFSQETYGSQDKSALQQLREFRDAVVETYVNRPYNSDSLYHSLAMLRNVPIDPPLLSPQLMAAATQLQATKLTRHGFIPMSVGSMQITLLGWLPELATESSIAKNIEGLKKLKVIRDGKQDMIAQGYVSGTFESDDGQVPLAFGDMWMAKDFDHAASARVNGSQWISVGLIKDGARAVYAQRGTGLCISICVNAHRTQYERAEFAQFVLHNMVMDVLAAPEREIDLRKTITQMDPALRAEVIKKEVHELNALHVGSGSRVIAILQEPPTDLERKLTANASQMSIQILTDAIEKWWNDNPETAADFFLPLGPKEQGDSPLPYRISSAGYEWLRHLLNVDWSDENVAAYLRALNARLDWMRLPLIFGMLSILSTGPFAHPDPDVSHREALRVVSERIKTFQQLSEGRMTEGEAKERFEAEFKRVKSAEVEWSSPYPKKEHVGQAERLFRAA